jgi:hypothetical protein
VNSQWVHGGISGDIVVIRGTKHCDIFEMVGMVEFTSTVVLTGTPMC